MCPRGLGYGPTMNREQLFLRLLQELAALADGISDDFQLLQASGHLRALLLDHDPLMHQMNRDRRLKISFEPSAEDAYTKVVLEDGPVFWAQMDGFSPRLAARPRQSEALKLDGLLAKRAAVVEGEDVSVKDLILQVANVEGGVHPGTPRTDLEQRLSQWSVALRIGGFAAVARTLRGIADVVVQGLEPLAAQVRQDLRS